MTGERIINDAVKQATALIAQRAPNVKPRIAVILGTGLGAALDDMDVVACLNYPDLPGFHSSSVQSHAGKLLLGRFANTDMAVMQGRFHLYEGYPPQAWLAPIRTLKAIGCETLIVTNAANALYKEQKPPSLMLITDHINAIGANPLVGKEGERFIDMSEAYDTTLRTKVRSLGVSLGITLHEGVYYAMLGPCFETKTEALMANKLGAHAIGMSTVPEVLAARQARMRVLGISALSNYAANLSDQEHTVEQVIAGANATAPALMALLRNLIAKP